MIRLRRDRLPDGVRALAWESVSSVIVWVSTSYGPAQRAAAARMALRALGVRRERILLAVPFIVLGGALAGLKSHPIVSITSAVTAAFATGALAGGVLIAPPSPSPQVPSIFHAAPHHRRRSLATPSPSPSPMPTAPATAPPAELTTPTPLSSPSCKARSDDARSCAPKPSASASTPRGSASPCLLNLRLLALGLRVCLPAP
jgi:hypothetical protein